MAAIALMATGIVSSASPGPLFAAPIHRVRAESIYSRPGDIFTQGLFFKEGELYESQGLYGRSAIRRWKLQDNSPDLSLLDYKALPKEIFAEGAVFWQGFIWVLTWKEGAVLRLDPEDLSLKPPMFYRGEGWGLCHDGERFWRSDGSDRLYAHKGPDFLPEGEPLRVMEGQKPVRDLNELEWHKGLGLILANIWHKPLVAAIRPQDGQVAFYLDLGALPEVSRPRNYEAVANGLALDDKGRLFVTGKYWPRLYQVAWDP
jgi:glutamine cyclotransferase